MNHYDQELVSILIPTFNRCAFLSKAIESSLAQSYSHKEIIVVDNASTDGTEELIKSYSSPLIRYYKQKRNVGLVRNWRTALCAAKGQYAVFLSDDNYFLESSYIERAVDLLKKDPQMNLVMCGCVHGTTDQGDKDFMPDWPSEMDGKEFALNLWEGSCHIPCDSQVFRRRVALTVNPFMCPFTLFSDIELWLRLLILGKTGLIKERAVYYRFHNKNTVNTMSYFTALMNMLFILRVFIFMLKNNINACKALRWGWRVSKMYYAGYCTGNFKFPWRLGR